MSNRNRTRWFIGLAGVGIFVFGGWVGLKGADDKADAPKSGAADKDPFAVPDGTSDDLLKFIVKTEQARPDQPKSQQDVVDFVLKTRKAIVTAADKILAGKPDDKTRVAAIKAELGALGLLDQVGDASAEKQLKELIDKIKDDKQPEIARIAKLFGFKNRIAAVVANPVAAGKLWDDIKAELTAAPEDKDLIMMAVQYGSTLERIQPEVAARVLGDVSAMLAKSNDPQMNAMAKKLEGTVRRLTLLGKPMEIKGTLVDGKEFDPASLKGKVVLVDFWATWCGPCRAELPNVKKNYEKYHDKGFEVIGVSLDQDIDDLRKFIADEKIAWPILFPREAKDQFWNNPLAVYYGVNGIPCVILMNQKGNVISLNARGPELGKMLAELLGGSDDKAGK